MREQLHVILEKLVIKNNIRIHQEEFKLQLFSHPSYPSLHSVTGVLNHFKIDNLALRLPTNLETLTELPPCFIANLIHNDREQLVLVEKKNNEVKITFDEKETMTINQEKFLEAWNGIIVAIEKEESGAQPIDHSIISKGKWAMYALGLFLIGNLVYLNADLFSSLHFILSIAGLTLSIFIAKHELGLQSATANNFCNLSANTSCDAVLDSKGATVLGLFKLSDISIVVFATYTLTWLLLFIKGTFDASLYFLTSISAIPFVLYSIYYQCQVVKKWCPLCLGIASVLLLQAGVLGLGDFSTASFSVDLQTALLFLLSLLISSSAWDFIKPLLKQKESSQKLKIEHYRFKRNFQLFQALYNKGESLSTSASISGEIILGNEDAPLEIILVTSPFCYYCKSAHADIEQLLHSSRDKLKVIIRSNIDLDKESERYQVHSQLLHYYNSLGETACEQALSEVYDENVDLKKWLQAQKKSSLPSYDDILEQQQVWCKANGINFTPALYVNGKPFPTEYERSDLLYFIDELIEEQQLVEQV